MWYNLGNKKKMIMIDRLPFNINYEVIFWLPKSEFQERLIYTKSYGINECIKDLFFGTPLAFCIKTIIITEIMTQL